MVGLGEMDLGSCVVRVLCLDGVKRSGNRPLPLDRHGRGRVQSNEGDARRKAMRAANGTGAVVLSCCKGMEMSGGEWEALGGRDGDKKGTLRQLGVFEDAVPVPRRVWAVPWR